MSRLRVRALVLAAGRGERLRPLTDELPKPALPVRGRPLITWTLDELAALRCEAIAVNLFHLGDRLRERLGERHRGVPLCYSPEPHLLGTLGALAPLREFLADCDAALVINGDSLCRWPLRTLLERHRASRSAATLLLAARAAAARFGGGVRVADDGRLLALRRGALVTGAARRGVVFAGAQVLAPRLLARVPDGPGDIVAGLYEPLLAEGETIQTLSTRRSWHDLGTPRRYLEGALERALHAQPEQGSWLAPGSEVAPTARLRRVAVESGASIAARARAEETLLLPGATIGEGAVARRVLLGPGARLPAKANAEGVLLTRGPDGELVTTPLDRGEPT